MVFNLGDAAGGFKDVPQPILVGYNTTPMSFRDSSMGFISSGVFALIVFFPVVVTKHFLSTDMHGRSKDSFLCAETCPRMAVDSARVPQSAVQAPAIAATPAGCTTGDKQPQTLLHVGCF